MPRIESHHRIDGPDGKPWVTLVTGIANDLWLWESQAAALARDIRVLRYDCVARARHRRRIRRTRSTSSSAI